MLHPEKMDNNVMALLIYSFFNAISDGDLLLAFIRQYSEFAV